MLSANKVTDLNFNLQSLYKSHKQAIKSFSLSLNELSTVDCAMLSEICRNRTVLPSHLVWNHGARNNTKTKFPLFSFVLV